MNVIAVAAEALEFRGWMRYCNQPAVLDWEVQFARSADWNGVRLHAVADGPGPVLAGRAARQAINHVQAGGEMVSALFSIGFCGALREGLAVGDVLCASKVGDGDEEWAARSVNGVKTVRLLSMDRFFGRVADKREWSAKGFAAVEMEAAGVGKVAAEYGVPFSAVKVVTDCLEEEFVIDFNSFRDSAGRFDRFGIARAVMRHPIRYGPDVCRMAMRGPRASEILGEALGKFRI